MKSATVYTSTRNLRVCVGDVHGASNELVAGDGGRVHLRICYLANEGRLLVAHVIKRWWPTGDRGGNEPESLWSLGDRDWMHVRRAKGRR